MHNKNTFIRERIWHFFSLIMHLHEKLHDFRFISLMMNIINKIIVSSILASVLSILRCSLAVGAMCHLAPFRYTLDTIVCHKTDCQCRCHSHNEVGRYDESRPEIKKQQFFKIFQRNLWIKEAIIHCRKAQISEWIYSIQESVNSLTGVIAGLSMPCRLLSFSFLWFLQIHSTKIPAVVTRRQTDPTTAPIMISTEITNRIDILYIYSFFNWCVIFK